MGKIVKLKNANNVYTYPITKTEAVYIEDNKTTLNDYLDATAIIKTAGPAQMVTFNDGANNMPVKSCIVNLKPYQEGSGDPSPTNIRPISGRTALTVTAAGDNLYHIEDKTHTVNGITWTYSNGVVTGNGTVVNASSFSDNVFTYLPAGTYTIYDYANNTSGYVAMQDASNNTLWRTLATTEATNPSTFTLTETTRCVTRCRLAVGTTVTNTVFKPMLMVGNRQAPTEFKPYMGNTYPITWESSAGTVYGGTLDVVSGVLTVDRVCIEMDGTTNGHRMTTTGSFDTLTVPFGYFPNGLIFGTNRQMSKAKAEAAGARSSHMPYSDLYNPTTMAQTPQSFYFRVNASNQFQIRVYNEGKDYVDTNTWFAEQKTAGTPVQIVYPIEEKSVYQLTPTEIKTLLGGNTVYTDAGSVSVDYVADTKLYIDNKIAELQALTSES